MRALFTSSSARAGGISGPAQRRPLLEAEMAAAREVQQVIVPEQSEPFPGYTVESVYQPARRWEAISFRCCRPVTMVCSLWSATLPGRVFRQRCWFPCWSARFAQLPRTAATRPLCCAGCTTVLLGARLGGFATALAAHINRDGMVTIANAGHLSPYLDGKEVELPGALPLGIADGGGKFEPKRFELRPGSRLTFYSDGVVEAQNKRASCSASSARRQFRPSPRRQSLQRRSSLGRKTTSRW